MRVAGAVPGDRVEVELGEDARGRPCATLVRVVSPGPQRVDPGCAQDRVCPGCQMRALAGDAQREHKRASWVRVLERVVPGSGARVEALAEAVEGEGYRSRLVAHALEDPSGQLVLGMRGAAGASVDLRRCPTQSAKSRAALEAITEALRRRGTTAWSGAGQGLRYVVVEAPPGEKSGVRVGLVGSPGPPEVLGVWPEGMSVGVGGLPADSEAVSMQGLRWVQGDGVLWPRVPEGALRWSPGAWFSNAPGNAVRVREVVLDALREGSLETVIEVGCGIGTHAFGMASLCRRYVGLDRDRVAIADAQYNAEQLGGGAEMLFRVGRAERGLRHLLKEGWRADAVVLHSMRRAFSPGVAQMVSASGAVRAVVVAPSLRALAGNLELLVESGYEVERIVPVETMPHTYHMMAVAVCRRAL